MKTVNNIVNFCIAFAVCSFVYILSTIMTCLLALHDWDRAKKEFAGFDFVGDMKEFK